VSILIDVGVGVTEGVNVASAQVTVVSATVGTGSTSAVQLLDV